MGKMYLGAQIYTLNKHIQTVPDFTDAMKKVAEMGYRYVQISGVGKDITPEIAKEVCDANQLVIGLTHTVDDERFLNDIDNVIREHNEYFTCDGVGMGGLPREFRCREGYMKFVEKYTPAFENLKKAGKVFCYHNHWFEFEHFDGKTGMEILLENTDPEAFKLTVDTAWLQKAGVDPAAFIRKYADRIYALHLKDATVVNDEPTLTEVLDGNMNFDTIIEEAQKAGIVWNFVEQDWGHINKDRFLSLKISHDNLMRRYGEYFE